MTEQIKTENGEQATNSVETNEMELQLVSFELAKLLKSVGFDWECEKVYDCWKDNRQKPYIGGDELEDNMGCKEIYAPTLDLAQKWFRDVHNIHLEVWVLNMGHENESFVANIKYPNFEDYYEGMPDKSSHRKSYEQAQEAGLGEACKYRISQLNKK